MKKYVSLIITVLILMSGIILTGCSSSEKNKLIECLTLTKSAKSMEGNLTSSTKMNGKTIDIKMNIQIEDVQKDMKGKMSMELLGKNQEFYFKSSNGNLKMYVRDKSGKYSATQVDSSQINGVDTSKSIESYIEVIENNPDMIKETGKNTYELNVPKEKADEIYSKITDQKTPMSLEGLKVEFSIGDDGYLQKVKVNANMGSIESEAICEYLNYNKKFDIVIPEV